MGIEAFLAGSVSSLKRGVLNTGMGDKVIGEHVWSGLACYVGRYLPKIDYVLLSQ